MQITSSRNLVIPKVVRAIGNIDTKPGATGRTNNESARPSTSARSKTSDKRRITLKKRIVPLDILTDAKINSSEV